MSMRQALGVALLSRDLDHHEHECAIDRVGALAHGSRLGRLLYHWKHADQPDTLKVQQELLRRARRRFGISPYHVDHPVLISACTQAMTEYYSPQCRQCSGAGELVTQRLRILCNTCGGSGLRRVADAERIAALGITVASYRNTWEPRIAELLLMLDAKDAGAAAEARRQLRSA